MAFRFKVGYTTDPAKIEPAITNGRLDEGDLIIVNEGGQGSLRFILQDKTILPFSTGVSSEELEAAIDKAVEEKLWTTI